MWTAAAYGVELAAKPYCLVCGEAFVTAMPQLVQEAVDALRSVGCEVEVRHADLPIR